MVLTVSDVISWLEASMHWMVNPASMHWMASFATMHWMVAATSAPQTVAANAVHWISGWTATLRTT